MVHIREHVPRDAEVFVDALIDEEPAILIEGPRGSGKSTLVRALAGRRNATMVDLDDEPTLSALREDATAFLVSPGLVVIDEFQRAPEVLSVVKRVVDREPGVGRFLLAGSVSGRLLPRSTETLTGRVHRLSLPPLSVAEVFRTSERWLSQVLSSGEVPRIQTEQRRPLVFDLITSGGYPDALGRASTRRRHRWFVDYLASVADRDLSELVDVRRPGAVGRLYRLLAERTAGTPVMAELGDALGLHPSTVRTYVDYLVRLYLVHELPGWTIGVSAKTAKRPKLHLTDTGLGAATLGIDEGRLSRSPLAGPFVESFVVGELLKQAAVIDEMITFSHFRDRSGVEVDLIIERVDGSVVAAEIKSTAILNRADAKGLRFLRDRLGNRFVAGVMFYAGPLTAALDDRIWATPIAALWGGGGPPDQKGST